MSNARADLIALFAEAVDRDRSYQAGIAHLHAVQILHEEGHNIKAFDAVRNLIAIAEIDAATLPERREMLQRAFELFRREMQNEHDPRKSSRFTLVCSDNDSAAHAPIVRKSTPQFGR